MKITKGTIIRTILLALVVINMILKQTGRPVIEIHEGTVASFVEVVVEIAAIMIAWWKNNSFTENAKKADEYMRELNNSRSD